MSKRIPTCIVLLLFPCIVCAAGTQDTRDAELKFYDARLNRVYQQIRGELSEEGKKYLRNAQRAWIQTRDNDCMWAFADKRDCLIDRTINRTQELKSSFFIDKYGKYIKTGRPTSGAPRSGKNEN